MAKTKLLHDFFKNRLTEKECSQLKGGRNYVPANSGSHGYVNWDDIEIRQEGFVVSSNTPVMLKVSKTSLNTFGN